MKKLIVISILICLFQVGKAQDFQFQMYFEDAVAFEIKSYPNPVTDYYFLGMSADLINEVRIVDKGFSGKLYVM
ncbi:MAG: hypothetical protein EOM83_02415 [Clostridia bacterium]|nr:hypothetical protein [Clostridia bacterium]